MNHRASRVKMVMEQLIWKGITDERVLQAFSDIPRHLFVQEALRNKAYADCALPIGEKQTISQPYTVAIMTELLQVEPHHRILELGTGSGYQAAILSRLAAQVYSVERIAILAEKAQEIVVQLGIKNIHIKTFDGTYGWREFSPFDRIIVTAAAPNIPEPLVEQLSGEEGKLVIPVGSEKRQMLVRLIKRGEERIIEEHGQCTFVPLLGRYGWKKKD
ncbi:MAG: protein-L-isoaspartate(D-aspartate) O-methyltransferase [Acidobacteriota bacterium]